MKSLAEVVDRDTITRRVSALGAEISADYAGRDPVLLGVLKGAVPFLADLLDKTPVNVCNMLLR